MKFPDSLKVELKKAQETLDVNGCVSITYKQGDSKFPQKLYEELLKADVDTEKEASEDGGIWIGNYCSQTVDKTVCDWENRIYVELNDINDDTIESLNIFRSNIEDKEYHERPLEGDRLLDLCNLILKLVCMINNEDVDKLSGEHKNDFCVVNDLIERTVYLSHKTLDQLLQFIISFKSMYIPRAEFRTEDQLALAYIIGVIQLRTPVPWDKTNEEDEEDDD